jgi:(1->4)-alpha-D-glucan 1-alpha-D-glucosylmutase
MICESDMPTPETLLTEALAAIAARRRWPEATYRLQFHAGFTFQDASRLTAYLRELGVTHVYASPYLKARPGSTHGYNITDHSSLNPEVGSEEDFQALVRSLREHGLGQIIDVVPNHMGIVGNENAWWNDVLENGPASQYAWYFDIDWDASPRPGQRGQLILPVLGDTYGEVLESGQLKLDLVGGAFFIRYHEHCFPVAPRTYEPILRHRLDELRAALKADDPHLMEYESILTAIKNLPQRTAASAEDRIERHREKEIIKRRLKTLLDESPPVREFLSATLAQFCGTPGDERSYDLLDELLNHQVYRLSYWRVSTDETNYRRFFDVNEMAALSMEREEVFAATHGLVFRLLHEGEVDGLRIDHPDGLFDPRGYLDRLQTHYVLDVARRIYAAEAHGDWPAMEAALRELLARERTKDPANPLWRPLYVVVEKILGVREQLPPNWPMYGTSGYYFLNVLNGLFVERRGREPLTNLYRTFTAELASFTAVSYESRFLILQVALASELYMLGYQLDRIAQRGRRTRDFTMTMLRHALREVIASFPVYRTYLGTGEIHDEDRRYIRTAVQRAKFRNPSISASVFDFVAASLLEEPADEEGRARRWRFAGKFEQLTAPVMAKGVEDTAFYRYNRLMSLNEVGGNPERFGITPREFHDYCSERQARFPYAMSATTTHDTKRSEDARTRLNVLSEIPDEFEQRLFRWKELNQPHHIQVEDLAAPDANEEYLLYQALLSVEPFAAADDRPRAEIVERVRGYVVKALREAKVHSSWINPNPAYEQACQDFVTALLDRQRSGAFLDDFGPFHERVAHWGRLASLAQTLLKIGSPGVPDFYQGTELWDDSLVDPDNRRSVDFEQRRELLASLKQDLEADRPGLVRQVTADMRDGRIKLLVIAEALRLRRERPGLFSSGEYLPLTVVGPLEEQIVAFARRDSGGAAVVAVPRLLSRLLADSQPLAWKPAWEDTAVELPAELSSGRWLHVFTGATLAPASAQGSRRLLASELFRDFPVALLTQA